MFLACVASVSNQVTERKLEREQKEGGRGRERGEEEVPSFPSPSPVLSFFLLWSQLSRRTREETLATQANMLFQYGPHFFSTLS